MLVDKISSLHSLRGNTKMPHTYFVAAGELRRKGQNTTTRALKPPQQKKVWDVVTTRSAPRDLSIGKREKGKRKEKKREGRKEGRKEKGTSSAIDVRMSNYLGCYQQQHEK